jgi:hypothetical protein
MKANEEIQQAMFNMFFRYSPFDESVRDQSLHAFYIPGCHDAGFTQVSFSFGGFTCQDMAGKSTVLDNFSGAGSAESFSGTFVCFYLWHCSLRVLFIFAQVSQKMSLLTRK